jgi:hypothetical protein
MARDYRDIIPDHPKTGQLLTSHSVISRTHRQSQAVFANVFILDPTPSSRLTELVGPLSLLTIDYISPNIPHIHIDIKCLIIHFIVMSHFFLDL